MSVTCSSRVWQVGGGLCFSLYGPFLTGFLLSPCTLKYNCLDPFYLYLLYPLKSVYILSTTLPCWRIILSCFIPVVYFVYCYKSVAQVIQFFNLHRSPAANKHSCFISTLAWILILSVSTSFTEWKHQFHICSIW